MNPVQLDADALRASFARIAPAGDAIPQYFYTWLFMAYPELRPMFPNSMTSQNDRLVQALMTAVSNVDRLDRLVPYLQSLGRDHRKYAVTADQYGPVGEALLATLAHFEGDRWTQALADQWSAAYDLIAETMQHAAAKAEQAGVPRWWDATVTDIQRPSPTLAVVTVQPDQPHPYRAGQSIPLATGLRANVWRTYSPANAPRPDHSITFHVRAVAGGILSPAIVYRLRPGDRVRLGQPVGRRLTLADNTDHRPLLLLAGGSGLAPLKAILEETIGTAYPVDPAPPVVLVTGARTPRAVYDWPNLTHLTEGPRPVAVIAAVDQPDPGTPGVTRILTGTPLDVARTHIGDLTGWRVYICGPPQMVADTTRALIEAGHPAELIHTEDHRTDQYTPHADLSLSPASQSEVAAR